MDLSTTKLVCLLRGGNQLAICSKDWTATKARPALTASLGGARELYLGRKAEGKFPGRAEETGGSFLRVRTDFPTRGAIRPAGAARSENAEEGEDSLDHQEGARKDLLGPEGKMLKVSTTMARSTLGSSYCHSLARTRELKPHYKQRRAA